MTVLSRPTRRISATRFAVPLASRVMARAMLVVGAAGLGAFAARGGPAARGGAADSAAFVSLQEV